MRLLALLTFVAACFSGPALASNKNVMTWTSDTGTTMRAEIVGEEITYIFRKEDGSIVKVPSARLDRTSQMMAHGRFAPDGKPRSIAVTSEQALKAIQAVYPTKQMGQTSPQQYSIANGRAFLTVVHNHDGTIRDLMLMGTADQVGTVGNTLLILLKLVEGYEEAEEKKLLDWFASAMVFVTNNKMSNVERQFDRHEVYMTFIAASNPGVIMVNIRKPD